MFLIEPQHRLDFGGAWSMGLHLRRRDVDYSDFAEVPENSYGIYLGCLGQWFVAQLSLLPIVTDSGEFAWKIEKVLEYDSLAELQQAWELD